MHFRNIFAVWRFRGIVSRTETPGGLFHVDACTSLRWRDIQCTLPGQGLLAGFSNHQREITGLSIESFKRHKLSLGFEDRETTIYYSCSSDPDVLF